MFTIPFGTLSADFILEQQALKRGHPVGRIGTLKGITAVVGEDVLYTKDAVHDFHGFVASKKLLKNPTVQRIHKYLSKT